MITSQSHFAELGAKTRMMTRSILLAGISKTEPSDEWVRDRLAWQGWQEYYPNRNDFNRTFMFSLMKFYHETDTWLFERYFPRYSPAQRSKLQ